MLGRHSMLLAPSLTGLPRFVIAQGDKRPVVTNAVQKVANTDTLQTMKRRDLGWKLGESFYMEFRARNRRA